MSGKRRCLGGTRGVGPRQSIASWQQDRVPATGANAIPLKPNVHWEKVLMSPKNASPAYEKEEDIKLHISSLCNDTRDLTFDYDRSRRAVQENDSFKPQFKWF